MTPKVKPNAPHRLIVEGKNDKFSILELMQRHGWDWQAPAPHFPFVDNAESVDKALEAVDLTVRTYSRVGIVLDADLEPTNRWEAVRNRLVPSGVLLPSTPSLGGTIVEAAGKRVGVWLMPDNKAPGKLEDFLALLIPPGDRCWPWAQEATVKAQTDFGAGVSELDRIKGQVHTWLAWQEKPGQPFGTAIRATAFAHDTPLASAFVDWMVRLYT